MDWRAIGSIILTIFTMTVASAASDCDPRTGDAPSERVQALNRLKSRTETEDRRCLASCRPHLLRSSSRNGPYLL
jgi:hypothetical protein